ncbi:hypothetical protein ACQEVX_05080 [Streptomyces syringium]|uniref:hypothetical protein n=1 Tax=Streptomyces syringium TaxID=76729 RepID=UPI003D8BD557
MAESLAEAVRRDAANLLADLRQGAWQPSGAEQQLADDLARGQWDSHWLRSGLRDQPPAVMAGRLVAVLHPAATVAETAGADTDAALRQLRVLMDAVAPAL